VSYEPVIMKVGPSLRWSALQAVFMDGPRGAARRCCHITTGQSFLGDLPQEEHTLSSPPKDLQAGAESLHSTIDRRRGGAESISRLSQPLPAPIPDLKVRMERQGGL
jgi:hypothetical protein